MPLREAVILRIMSIILSDLAYHYDNHSPLFQHLNLSVGPGEKISIVGDNGTGKSTLLQLVAGLLHPTTGTVSCDAAPYYVPQRIGCDGLTVAEALGVQARLAALAAITAGSTADADYDALADDWDVEARCLAALEHWRLPGIGLATPMDTLSGGEKTKVFLAGLQIDQPAIVLLDEPTNHLDTAARRRLYDYMGRTKAAVIVVSHDRTLLERIDTTYELSLRGLKAYGGNYSFYKEQKELETGALEAQIGAEERNLRQARTLAQEVRERQERRESRGEQNKYQLTRGMRQKAMNQGENTQARLQGKHERIITESREKLDELRARRDAAAGLKIDFDDATLHTGKLLVSLRDVNYAYASEKPLWPQPIDLDLFSGDRLRLTGANGSGKTTLVKILTGELTPTAGTVKRADFTYVYLDQEYARADTDLTVLELAQCCNVEKLADHEVKTRLHRALFPAERWDASCRTLSGGERMRLCLCCLMLSNSVPDLFVLDEPTNNLDIASMEILTHTIRDYRGTLLLISHDDVFSREVGIEGEIAL